MDESEIAYQKQIKTTGKTRSGKGKGGLLMDEYIERDRIIKNSMLHMWKKADLLRAVKEAPTADVVEVVRCKDCEYAKPYERNDGQVGYYCQHQNCTFLYGTNWERLFEPIKEANDFCSYGEKMNGKGDGE